MTAESDDRSQTPSNPDKNSGPAIYPLLPLRDVVVFPYMVVPLFVGRKKSIRAIEEAMMKDRKILLVSQKQAKTDEPALEDLYGTGTVAEILQLLKLPDGILKILVEGTTRAKITSFTKVDEYFEVSAGEVPIPDEKDVEVKALMRSINSLFEQYVKINKKIPMEVIMVVNNVEEPGRLADIITAHLALKVEEKQEILELFSPKGRLEKIAEILNRELEIMMVEKKIRGQVRKQMEQIQKEYYLREQMKAIQKELGETDERGEEIEELKQAIAKAKMPKEAREKTEKELNKLTKMPPGSAEATVSRNYIDWLVSLPWSRRSKDKLELPRAEKILEEDHFGLLKVKERILEYLAVCKLKKKLKGPILCLIGPPGVGKTSLGRSIARSMGRKFARISLGGMRDEAEIRGHRRTYVGALPGRIMQALRETGTRNPVILLDEIDKMGMDFRGDPSSALLEVLDPEQNYAFSDHYIATPFDCSDVLFLTTANVPHTIPGPLKDRMEIVFLPGYTEEEKLEIAKRYLVPKQVEANGLEKVKITFADDGIRHMIRLYTREAGVRNLEREVAGICRKIARKVVGAMPTTSLEGEGGHGDSDKASAAASAAAATAAAAATTDAGSKKKAAKAPAEEEFKVNPKAVETYLGVPRFHPDSKEEADEVGVATGLAWTEVGGAILPVEVTVMPGKGKMMLTGSLGQVMKESAHAALSYLRSHADAIKLPKIDYDRLDMHIHFPEGATPKDGPSAGITITMALFSALAEVPVSKDVAMTGEITLRGKILPVGGIKEKLLAAHRNGITRIVMSHENAKDLEEIPAEIRKAMDIRLVKSAVEAMDLVLVSHPRTTPKRPWIVSGEGKSGRDDGKKSAKLRRRRKA